MNVLPFGDIAARVVHDVIIASARSMVNGKSIRSTGHTNKGRKAVSSPRSDTLMHRFDLEHRTIQGA
jgi:hypothetical protein